MQILASPEIIISLSLALGLVISMIVLLVLQARNSARLNKLTYPAELTVEKAQATADEILGEARRQARQIVAGAEAQGRQIALDHATETKALRESYERALSDMKDQFNNEVVSVLKASELRSEELINLFSASIKYQESDMKEKISGLIEDLSGVPERLSDEAARASVELKDRVARAAEEIERSLSLIQEESSRQISEHLAKKFDEAEKDIEAYREGRQRVLDKHLTTLVKDVVKVTLQKELKAEDHAELVRRALSEAREGSLI